MIASEQSLRFQDMERMAPRLRQSFAALTAAHQVFQGEAALRSISVSDVLDNGSIEATFSGVRIKFELLPIFGTDRRPRGRVACLHCHCVYGEPVQAFLGAFTFGPEGLTDLEPDIEGNFPRMDSDAAAIILRYLDAALMANRTL